MRRTLGAAVVAADAQPLGVALNVFVVEFDPQRPAQVRLPHRVLQASPGVGEPVGHLRGTKQEGDTHGKQEDVLMSRVHTRSAGKLKPLSFLLRIKNRLTASERILS